MSILCVLDSMYWPLAVTDNEKKFYSTDTWTFLLVRLAWKKVGYVQGCFKFGWELSPCPLLKSHILLTWVVYIFEFLMKQLWVTFLRGQLWPKWPEKENLWWDFTQTAPKLCHNDLLVRYVDCQSTGVIVTGQKCRGYGTAQVVYGYIVRFCTFGKK